MDTRTLLAELIRFESITPDDAGCQEFMIRFLENIGFHCQRINREPVNNFFARYGSKAPLLVFAGHTDVVPTGDRGQWTSDPFVLTERDGMAYGRGSADMKGSLAAMMSMVQRFVSDYPDFDGSLGLLITSGEEGDRYDLGTPQVMQALYQQGDRVDYCIVGEPSSTSRVGDLIKIGRRGSLTAHIRLQGIQGHVAYPHLAENPIHRISPALLELSTRVWDEGNEHFPPTSFQVTHIHAGGEAGNIIPGQVDLHCNFRFSTEQTEAGLKTFVEDCFARHNLHPQIDWRLSGNPFLTARGRLLECSRAAIVARCGEEPVLSTSGGTSDARFIAPYGVEVIELGPVNATIHQVNECVSLADLDTLTDLYYDICRRVFLLS